MADDTAEEAIERGMDAYFAGDTIKDLLEGIDIDAIAEGAPLDDAVEYERLGRVLGALIGRAAARGASSTGLLGRIVKESVGSEVGGRVGEAAVAVVIENATLDEHIDGLRTALDPGQLAALTENRPGPGSALEIDDTDGPEWTEIEVEDAEG